MSSVSRVLSGHPDVSRGMQERVLAAVAELRYEPDLLAHSLRRQETMTIGFAVGALVTWGCFRLIQNHWAEMPAPNVLASKSASGNLDGCPSCRTSSFTSKRWRSAFLAKR